MSRQFWQEALVWATAPGTTVSNTTTETPIFSNITIPANYMQDGRSLALRAMGEHNTLGSGTVTLAFRLAWGDGTAGAGTTICKTGTITTLISAAHWLWDIDLELTTRSNGSSGTIMGNGKCIVYGGTAPTVGSATGAPAIAPMTNGGQATPAVMTGSLVADTPLSLTVVMGAASTSNTVIGHNLTLKSLN